MEEQRILAIESSCDETAAAVVKNGREVLSNIISSQIALHTVYGGVVPEIASRKHVENIDGVIMEALQQANVTLQEIDAVAVTYGPGLVGALLVGLAEAKALKILYNLDIEDEIDIQALHKDMSDSMSLIPYEKSVDETREELFNIDTSIVKARCGVANLGIIGITSSNRAPRLSSLITRTCIVLLKKQDIVAHLYEGVQKLKACGNEEILPSNMIFIAGPSRTADIELQTVFGVHGSLRTYVILY